MSLSNVKLILFREVRDQLRDRRTIFMIAVLPLLLYPLLGMSFFQVAQFQKTHPTRVLIVGADELPAEPPLIEYDPDTAEPRFPLDLCGDAEEQRLLEVSVVPGHMGADSGDHQQRLREALESGPYDALVYFPPGFRRQLERFRSAEQVQSPGEGNDTGEAEGAAAESASRDAAGKPRYPQPELIFDTADDQSRVARNRLWGVLASWKAEIVRDNLVKRRMPAEAAQPFQVEPFDLAKAERKRAAIWSKILPFVLLVWALTGAFYPAVDLCAGEKERGTLETLLCSPALRSEIVTGKLLAIMLFSMVTSLLNLASMGLTGTVIIYQMQRLGAGGMLDFGPPPLASMGWLVVALIPISALFSALALAVAALARSTKEGQYYLMPLLLVCMPLMVIPLFPAAELDLGSSLIPITGMMFLLRALMEGQYHEALLYSGPVLAMTGLCCLLAVRWAIDQFNNESVLFRESEQWDMRLWMRHLFRDRGPTPTVAMAVLCGVLLLVIQFFARLVVPPLGSWTALAVHVTTTLVALIAVPAVLMTLFLTRSPRKTLLLKLPKVWSVPAALALAVVLHPVAMVLVQAVSRIYELSDSAQRSLVPVSELIRQAPLPAVLLVMALVPAVCEELAFRGFILSGLRHLGHKWRAIFISSALFAVTHGVLQQSISAMALGLVLGFLAVQTGSLLPCILFHFVYNSLGLLVTRITAETMHRYPVLEYLFQRVEGGYLYRMPVVAVGGFATIVLLLWFRGLPYRLTEEENLNRVLEKGSAHASAS